MRPVALFPCLVSRLSLWCVALGLMLFARASVPSLPSPAPSVFMHLISLMLSNRDVTRLPRHFSLLLLILFYYFFPFVPSRSLPRALHIFRFLFFKYIFLSLCHGRGVSIRRPVIEFHLSAVPCYRRRVS